MESPEQKVQRLVREPIALVPYDPRWPVLFRAERDRLQACLPAGVARRIEHFGSTAVPGLAAKPVVDLLVEVADLQVVRERVAPRLEAQGYEYLWRPTHGDDGPPFYAWFIRRDPATGARTHHIHMVEAQFTEHWDRLLFRDHLIAHPELARDYEALKRRLAAATPHDRAAYTAGKSEFIARVTDEARRARDERAAAAGELADEYRRQFAWRSWSTALDALPPLRSATVLDLGCGPGDLSAELVACGARVIGFDGNEELLAAARARNLPDAEFRAADLRALPDPGVDVDGVWASFSPAFFTDLAAVLPAWTRRLRPGGWLALTEMDDLFGHEPLPSRVHELLGAYADEALAAGRYDFRMGRRLRAHVERAGFTVVRELVLPDLEFSFDGPARPDVLEGWRRRFDRMALLRERCGAEFEAVRDGFLACLARPEHRATARVRFCLARRGG